MTASQTMQAVQISTTSPQIDNNGQGDSREMGHSETFWGVQAASVLPDVQLRAIELTVQGYGDVRIAEMLSVDRKTLWRWKTTDDVYRQALNDARCEVHCSATDRYQHILVKATAVLAKLLDDEDANVRLRSAQVLLTMAGAFRPIVSKNSGDRSAGSPLVYAFPPATG